MAGSCKTRDEILAFVRSFKQREGYSPTVREIASHCAVKSPSVVQYHLNCLEREGRISRGREKFRAISVVTEPETDAVPLLGRIAAGHPVPVPDAESLGSAERVAIPLEITKGKRNVFALEVKGNSMVDAMIGDGDIVVMEQVYEVSSGDVVAVWLKNEQEVTLKKIYFENEQVRLQPCNPYMMPIYHKADNVEVQGKVIAVIRINR